MHSPFTLGQLAVWHHPISASYAGKKQGRILVLHGLSEHSGRHLNTVDWFTARGFEVMRFDFRGAGKSGGRAQWIQTFNDYVEDTISVFLWIQRNLDDAPLFVLGHSLGGAVAIHFAGHYGNQFEGLILSAPAYLTGSNIAAWKIHLGKVLVKFFPRLRIPTIGDNSALSRDPLVGEAYGRDPLSYHFNTLQQGDEILKALEQVPHVCKSIRTPTLIVHGTSDRVIRHEGSFTVLKSLSSRDKELIYFPNGYHEPHNDTNRNEYFGMVSLWVDRQLKSLSSGLPRNVVDSFQLVRESR